MANDPARHPAGIDPSTPSAARMYDVYLGGKDHYAADREAAVDLYENIPELPRMAWVNRMWLHRVIHFLAEEGIDQFIDIGSGLPTANNTHEVAHRLAPGTRVVYVDYDPHVVTHARALLADDPASTGVVQADLRRPSTILGATETQRLIDFTRPVAVLVVAVVHFLRDEDRPYEVMATLREALPPGSYIALSHVDSTTAPDRAAYLEQIYASTSSPGKLRSHTEIARFFEGLELVDPGLGYVADWRPDPAELSWPPDQAWVYGGVGRQP